MKAIYRHFSFLNILLYLAIGALIPICIWPFLNLGLKTFIGEMSFSKLFESQATIVALKNTVLIAFLTSIFSALLATPLAFLFSRTNLPMQNKWRSLFSLPYAIPPYVGALAWIILANPSNGLLNVIIDSKWLNIYSIAGLIWVESCFLYTFILLSLLQSLDRMDPSFEEAARLSGAPPFKVFFTITLPIIMPSLVSGMLLVFLAAAASFGVPALIGGPGGIYLLTTRIYTFQRMGNISGMLMASGLSFLLLILAVIILLGNQYLQRGEKGKTVGGKTGRPSVMDLGKYKNPIQIIVGLLFSVIFILPIGGILFSALSKVQGVLNLQNLGLQNFTKIFFETAEATRAFSNSLSLALVAATLAAILGLFLAYFRVKSKVRGASVVELIASLPYAAPGTVLALGLLLAFTTGWLGKYFYMSWSLLMLAYLSKYLNFSLRTCADGLEQIDDSLAQAARVAGAGPFTVLRTIWFPLLLPAIIASWFLVFMPAFSELTMTILMTGPGLETVGTLLFQMQEYGDASGGGAAVLALLIVILVASINWLVKILSKGKYGL